MIEEPAFYPWMTGRVNLEVLGATGGGCGRGEVARVLSLVGLADVADRKVKTYSQGMRQRLGIAAAMLGRRLPDPRAVAQAGSMIEEPAFYPWMTGRVNLEVLGATGGGCGPGEVARVLRLAGLNDVAVRKVTTYSQGMRQRLGIAAAMLGRPRLLIVDEPTNGLDPAGIKDIRDLLRGLAAEGTTVFLSSHLLAEVEQVCDRVAVIVGGRLVEEGAPAMLGAIRRRVRGAGEGVMRSAATRYVLLPLIA
jgi:ABC-2 type transport system ATP-binding protein